MLVAAALLWASGGIAAAQLGERQPQGLPDSVPPPLPPREPPKDAPGYDAVITETGQPWELPLDLRAALEHKARTYESYLQSFTCDETVRRAEYDSGEVTKERVQNYGYLLVKDATSDRVRESRREFAKNGELRPSEVLDEEPFPPAYEWVFLFSTFHQPLFSYRYVGQYFDGFDLVYEVQFRGALPFTDGRDIRQWEGRVLLDAFTYTPLDVEAEPSGQRDRVAQLFDSYNRSFNILGMRTGKRPLTHHAHIELGLHKELPGSGIRLTFPTQLRYDTRSAVSPRQVVPVRASTRKYSNYKFFTITDEPLVGDGPKQ